MKTGNHKEWFFEKVIKGDSDDDCWLWKAGKSKSGYAIFGDKGKPAARAHRVIWEWENGPIPKGMVIMHMCDVRHCVNPKHLKLGTHKENVHDCMTKGRKPVGDNHPNSKLSDNDANYARQFYFAERRSKPEIAKFFGVTPEAIHAIIIGKTHKRHISHSKVWSCQDF